MLIRLSSRKYWMGVGIAAIVLALTGCGASEMDEERAGVQPAATIEGPVAGPGELFPSLREVPPGTGLADYGYEVNEYFISGEAAGEPYTTRLLVRAPKDPADFSGIVLAEPMHMTGNSWMFYFTRIYDMSRGHASIEIASQKGPTEERIVASNPERYKAIHLASDKQSNEILAQAGELIKANLAEGPLPGRTVRKVILMGTSQSAATTRAYMASEHARSRMADGSAIFDGFLPTSTGGPMPVPSVDVPVIQVATQTEVRSDAESHNGYRREDGDEPGDQFRLYEMAGMAHNDSRENPSYQPEGFCDLPLSRFPMGAMNAMALDHLIQWADRGVLPPRADRIVMDYDEENDGSPLSLDHHGNAQGGVRNTYVDVPVAKLGVPNRVADPKYGDMNQLFCAIAGYVEPMSVADLKEHYGSEEMYRQKVEARLAELMSQGWFLPEYETQVRHDMEQVEIR